MATSRPLPHSGFSLVEVLIVIGIIGLLVGLIAPAISSVRSNARMTLELSAARQLMTAYTAYATTHADYVIPGYGDLIPNDAGNPNAKKLKAYDSADTPIAGGQLDTARKRWLWRLAPYLQYNLRGLYTNENQDVLDRLEQEHHQDYLYKASVSPSLGLNSEWIGGDSGSGAYGFLPPDSPLRTQLDFDRYYITSMSQVQRGDTLLVFASARGSDSSQNSGAVVEGYYRITSPYFTELTGTRWSDRFNAAEPPINYGHLSPRHKGLSVTAFIDGHTDTLTADQLQDMRHWANWATDPQWRLPRLPPP